MGKKTAEVTISLVQVSDPKSTAYRVRMISRDDGVWFDTFDSKEQLRAFLRGVKAGWSMAGQGDIKIPPIPKKR